MPFQIVNNDITKMKVDAIVNAANTDLLMGGGVCGAIFNAAGARELQAECDTLSPIKTGEAVITKGYNLPAKYIIHTAGPIWHGGTDNEEEKLGNCYFNSLTIAKNAGAKSIAFPLISSGIYGYPKDEAKKIATDTILKFLDALEEDDMDVFLVVFNTEDFEISKTLHNDIQSFIDENYVEESEIIISFQMSLDLSDSSAYYSDEEKLPRNLADIADQLEETFQERLLRHIREKNLENTEVYRRANIDRKLFSKIINPKGYKTSKNTIIALAIALKLSLDETNDLLATEGFTLSYSSYFDLIIIFCITNKILDIYKVNEILFAEIEQTLRV